MTIFFYKGNKYIYLLTKESHPEIFFKLRHSNGIWYYAKYRDFYVESEANKYTLHFLEDSYNGTAGWFMFHSNDLKNYFYL